MKARIAGLSAVALIAMTGACARQPPSPPGDKEGMRWIAGGEFTMGSEAPAAMANEGPEHRVRVAGFWIDEHPVTNEQFERFVRATGYVTTAERVPDWEELKKQLPPGTPKPDASVLVPGSSVFVPPPGPVPLDRVEAWWQWTADANWQHPEGPESSIRSRARHPAVHVSWDDAVAYATWAGRELPTEAEWEFAARGGRERQPYAWGHERHPGGKFMANTFQGEFPHHHSPADGFRATSPVGSFPPNGYGLFDMAGNVWQWTADWYRADTFAERADEGVCDNPAGPANSVDAHSAVPRRVIKGGSFLCHESYCESYRPSARRGMPPDTGSSHVGFRLVKRR